MKENNFFTKTSTKIHIDSYSLLTQSDRQLLFSLFYKISLKNSIALVKLNCFNAILNLIFIS